MFGPEGTSGAFCLQIRTVLGGPNEVFTVACTLVAVLNGFEDHYLSKDVYDDI